jgi:hypothetical protein
VRRLVLALFVVGFVAVGCTPTNPSPTTASTTTAPAQGLREVIISAYAANNYGIDSAYYPEGATISAQVAGAFYCHSLGTVDAGTVLGSEVCDESGTPPVPLLNGEHRYIYTFEGEGGVLQYGVGDGVYRIRW